jgi:hypothetical protein
MPALRDQDFDKLAGQIVDRFFSGQAKLADAAADIAQEHSLNPDQIERLVQAANTQTFLRGMDDRKRSGVGDLMHEFDPIDSRQVIKIVIDGAGIHINPHAGSAPGHEEGEETVDEMEMPEINLAEGEDGHKDTPEVEACEEECHDKLDPAHTTTLPRKEAAVMRAHKLAGLLEDQRRQAEWAFEDKFNALADRFRRVNDPTNYSAFEKDAMVEYGDETGLAIVNALRERRRMVPLEKSAAFEKVAALKDRHVSDDSLEFRMFEELHKIAQVAAELDRSIAYVRSQCA